MQSHEQVQITQPKNLTLVLFMTFYDSFNVIHDSITSFSDVLNSQAPTVFRFRSNSSTSCDVMFSCDVAPVAFRCCASLDWALDVCRADTKRFYNFVVCKSMQF